MATVAWKEDKVIGVRLKDGAYAIAQMMISPRLAFFRAFPGEKELQGLDLKPFPILFYCSVLRQFLQQAEIVTVKAAPVALRDVPAHWIKSFPGSRMVTLWAGTEHERTLKVVQQRAGGRLVQKDIRAKGFVGNDPVTIPDIPLDDDRTIDAHELDVLWTYPFLNERLYLCRKLGRNVDPMKDIAFDRQLPLDYKDFVSMMAGLGKREDYGYKDAG